MKKKKHPKDESEEMRQAREQLGSIALLAGSTVAFLAIYYAADYFGWSATFWVYFAALFLSLVAYVIWNHGFSRAHVTPDMLPDTWSAEEKQKFFDDAKKWKEDSKFLLYVIIPLAFTFFIDAVKLLLIDRWF